MPHVAEAIAIIQDMRNHTYTRQAENRRPSASFKPFQTTKPMTPPPYPNDYSYDVLDEQRLQNEELADYNDDSARNNDAGWFYPESDSDTYEGSTED